MDDEIFDLVEVVWARVLELTTALEELEAKLGCRTKTDS